MSSLRAQAFRDLLTFTRSTVGTYCDAAGVLQTADVNAPRIEYDPVSHAVRGLLIEQSRTNYILRSQEFDNASWTKTRASVTANVAVAPDLTVTADKLVEDTTVNDLHFASQSYTKGSSTEVQAYVASIWAKAAGRSQLRLSCQGTSGSANSAVCIFDLSAGTAGAVTASGAWDNTQARIEAWPNGWYRCMLDFRVNNDGQAAVQMVVMPAVGGVGSYTGDGSSGLYLWGAQLEKGVHPTSYVATTTAATARGADVCHLTDLDPWFEETHGTIFAEYLLPWSYLASDTTFHRIIQLDAGDEDDRFILYTYTGNRYSGITAGTVTQMSANHGAYAQGVVQRQALAYAENDCAAIGSGGSVSTDASAKIPTNITRFNLGMTYAGTQQLNGYLRKVRFYPRRLTNAEITALVA